MSAFSSRGASSCLGDVPRGVDHLVGEVRMLAGDALAPRGEALGFELDQQDAAAGGDAEAGFKRMRQRHVHLAQVDGFNLHDAPSQFVRRDSSDVVQW